MATTAKNIPGNFFTRIRASLKNRKKNPDWARVEEPDMIMRPVQFIIMSLILISFLMLFAIYLMNGNLVQWVAAFLFSLNSPLSFTELYAAFSAAIVFLICFPVMLLLILTMQPDNDDIVEMMSDLDANFQERIVELENNVNEKLDAIKRDV